MYLVWPSPCRRASGRIARWPTAGVWRLASGTRTSRGKVTSGAADGARINSSTSSSDDSFSATTVFVFVSMGSVLLARLRGLRRRSIACRFLRYGLDRFDHLGVAGAPAQISGERVANLVER